MNLEIVLILILALALGVLSFVVHLMHDSHKEEIKNLRYYQSWISDDSRRRDRVFKKHKSDTEADIRALANYLDVDLKTPLQKVEAVPRNEIQRSKS